MSTPDAQPASAGRRRLVVTGLDEAGRATVGEDRSVDVDGRARDAVVVWSTDGDGAARSGPPSSPIPGAGGATFVLLVLPPAGSDQAVIPLHTTPTVDFGVVVAGAVTLDLEDGSTVDLRTGDLIVQTETEHGWRNVGSDPCVIAFTMLAARR